VIVEFPRPELTWKRVVVRHPRRKLPSKRRIKARFMIGRLITMRAVAHYGLADMIHAVPAKYDPFTETVRRK